MTVAALPSDSADPDFHRGRADAYDEHQAGTDVETLEDRYEWMTDPTTARTARQLLSTAYLHGYRAFIEDLAAEKHWKRYIANTEYAAWLEATR
ncbi:hypothetical protein [Streptomyces africanus]|uniref:hypothetical protein n=1 Tax=Streptomyces africanus TaxID=231024 RepID=UPI000A3BA98A|nr:hypothetical protein [Streptomyces africanus]